MAILKTSWGEFTYTEGGRPSDVEIDNLLALHGMFRKRPILTLDGWDVYLVAEPQYQIGRFGFDKPLEVYVEILASMAIKKHRS